MLDSHDNLYLIFSIYEISIIFYLKWIETDLSIFTKSIKNDFLFMFLVKKLRKFDGKKSHSFCPISVSKSLKFFFSKAKRKSFVVTL